MSWQPIETAPRDGTLILGLYTYGTANPDYGIIRWTATFEDGGVVGWWTDQFCDEAWNEPQLWQPLPEPPK